MHQFQGTHNGKEVFHQVDNLSEFINMSSDSLISVNVFEETRELVPTLVKKAEVIWESIEQF